MIDTLDEYFLLQEVVRKTDKHAIYYRRNCNDHIITILHNRYIKRKCLPYSQREKMTSLYNCIPLTLFAEYLCCSKKTLIKRIDFMKKNPNIKYFDFKEIEAVTYIEVDDDIKNLVKKYSGVILEMNNECKKFNIKHNRFFGDLNIGFWE
jgi:hypothetical protein